MPNLRSTLFAMALLVSAGVSAHAAPAVSFSQSLPPAERTLAGFDRLTPTQLAALDALIQRDVDSARQGDVVAFAKSFTVRRTPAERQRAGIDSLTDAQRAELDRVVAAAIASRPAAPTVTYRASTSAPESVWTEKPHAEVHGEVSMFYGVGSHGASAYGSSLDAVVVDPSKKFALGVGISEVHTRGEHGCWGAPIW